MKNILILSLSILMCPMATLAMLPDTDAYTTKSLDDAITYKKKNKFNLILTTNPELRAQSFYLDQSLNAPIFTAYFQLSDNGKKDSYWFDALCQKPFCKNSSGVIIKNPHHPIASDFILRHLDDFLFVSLMHEGTKNIPYALNTLSKHIPRHSLPELEKGLNKVKKNLTQGDHGYRCNGNNIMGICHSKYREELIGKTITNLIEQSNQSQQTGNKRIRPTK